MSVTHLSPQHRSNTERSRPQQMDRVAGRFNHTNSELSGASSQGHFQQVLASQLATAPPASTSNLGGNGTQHIAQQAGSGTTSNSYNGWDPTSGVISPAVADLAARDIYFGESPSNDISLVSAVTNIPVEVTGDISNPVQLSQPAPQDFLNALANPGVTFAPNTGYVVNTNA